MLGKWLTGFLLLGLLTMLANCAPVGDPARGSRAEAPAPVTAPAAPSASAPSGRGPSAEDAAWAGVIEAAKKEGRLTIYSYNFTGDLGVALARAFHEKYGIRVEIVTGRGAEFLERMKTERRMGKMLASWTEGSPIHVMNMKKEGLTLGGNEAIPALRDERAFVLSPYALDPADKHLVGHSMSVYTPYVNVKLVKKGEEPRLWKDLLNPRWKGKMMLSDARVSSNAYLLFVPLLREKIVDEDYLKALYKQDLTWTVGSFEELGMLARGQAPLSVRQSDAVAARFAMDGAPIQAIDMDDGIPVSMVVSALLDGPHPNAAKVFMNWVLTEEGQTIQGQLKGSSPFRKDARDFRPAAVALTLKKPVLTTNEDTDRASRWFSEKYFDKLWGR